MVNVNKVTANDNEIYKETNHLPVLSNVFKLELTANKELAKRWVYSESSAQ